MRQKVLLSAALLHDPKIIILDEPASGLDVGTALTLRALVASLAKAGRIIFYSSHELDTVEPPTATLGSLPALRSPIS